MSVINDFLFYILGGVPLVNTFWILPWIIFWAAVMSWPLLLSIQKTWRQMWVLPVSLICFFGGGFIGLTPGIGQLQQIRECRTFEFEASSELSEPKVIALKECRRKSNVYEEFGPWTIQ